MKWVGAALSGVGVVDWVDVGCIGVNWGPVRSSPWRRRRRKIDKLQPARTTHMNLQSHNEISAGVSAIVVHQVLSVLGAGCIGMKLLSPGI